MKLKVFLLLICILPQRLYSRLPDVTPQLQVEVSETNVVSSLARDGHGGLPGVSRLPGLCRRLKRRRINVLCNREKFCWRGQSQRAVQVCLCPRGYMCSHFFIHSL